MEMVDQYSKELKFNADLQTHQDNKRGNDALRQIKQFYKDNRKICQKAYNYYYDFECNTDQYILDTSVIDSGKFKNSLPPTTILVLTVTSIEKSIFLHWLYDQQKSPLTSYFVNEIIFTVYSIDDNTMIIHANALHTGDEGTRIILNQIRKVFSPTYLFMLGICYGLDREKSPIGTIFISNSVSTFRLNFRDEEKSEETKFEAEDEYNRSPKDTLIRKIEQLFAYKNVHSIVSETDQPTKAKPLIGTLLSSNSLVSSHKVKQAVLEQYSTRKPKPLGGEMEAAGIFKSSFMEEDGFENWMIIKSVCDFGEKKNLLSNNEALNERVKDSLQAFAMSNTCGAFERALKIFEGVAENE